MDNPYTLCLGCFFIRLSFYKGIYYKACLISIAEVTSESLSEGSENMDLKSTGENGLPEEDRVMEPADPTQSQFMVKRKLRNHPSDAARCRSRTGLHGIIK